MKTETDGSDTAMNTVHSTRKMDNRVRLAGHSRLDRSPGSCLRWVNMTDCCPAQVQAVFIHSQSETVRMTLGWGGGNDPADCLAPKELAGFHQDTRAPLAKCQGSESEEQDE